MTIHREWTTGCQLKGASAIIFEAAWFQLCRSNDALCIYASSCMTNEHSVDYLRAGNL